MYDSVKFFSLSLKKKEGQKRNSVIDPRGACLWKLVADVTRVFFFKHNLFIWFYSRQMLIKERERRGEKEKEREREREKERDREKRERTQGGQYVN